MNIRRRRALVTVSLAAVACTAAGVLGAGAANASTPSNIVQSGRYAVTETIINNTPYPLTLDTSHTTADGTWVSQPQQTLDAKTGETVSEYTNNIGGMDPVISYTLPNGEYAVFFVFDTWAPDDTNQGVWGKWVGSSVEDSDSSFTESGSHSSGDHIWATMQINHV